MKILHTSDWHIGRSLYGRKRYDEFEAFLDWLAHVIEEENINVLLVAGDVFDNSTPSNRAQELYYRFLARAAAPVSRHVVITAGNHDSPSLLDASRGLLKFLNIHVVGCPSDSPMDEVFILAGGDSEPRLMVCAIPYLRDRDIRIAEAGESIEDKERKIIEGIRNHYRAVCDAAREQRDLLGQAIPIIAMGHLFASGGQTAEGDGVRELYIGSLAQVRTDVFPDCIDYLALGHLHIPQRVGGSDFIRYAGSPLPIGFGETDQEKSVVVVEFSSTSPATVTTIPVPRFQELKSLQGDWESIARAVDELRSAESSAWLEVVYEGDEIAGSIRERLDEALQGTALEILRVKNNRVVERVLGRVDTETLDELDVAEVFERCLETHEVPEEQRPALMNAYQEVVVSLCEADPGAE